MKLHKKCSCCQNELTTKSVYSIGRRPETGLWLNCKNCHSTMLLLEPNMTLKEINEIKSALKRFHDNKVTKNGWFAMYFKMG